MLFLLFASTQIVKSPLYSLSKPEYKKPIPLLILICIILSSILLLVSGIRYIIKSDTEDPVFLSLITIAFIIQLTAFITFIVENSNTNENKRIITSLEDLKKDPNITKTRMVSNLSIMNTDSNDIIVMPETKNNEQDIIFIPMNDIVLNPGIVASPSPMNIGTLTNSIINTNSIENMGILFNNKGISFIWRNPHSGSNESVPLSLTYESIVPLGIQLLVESINNASTLQEIRDICEYNNSPDSQFKYLFIIKFLYLPNTQSINALVLLEDPEGISKNIKSGQTIDYTHIKTADHRFALLYIVANNSSLSINNELLDKVVTYKDKPATEKEINIYDIHENASLSQYLRKSDGDIYSMDNFVVSRIYSESDGSKATGILVEIDKIYNSSNLTSAQINKYTDILFLPALKDSQYKDIDWQKVSADQLKITPISKWINYVYELPEGILNNSDIIKIITSYMFSIKDNYEYDINKSEKENIEEALKKCAPMGPRPNNTEEMNKFAKLLNDWLNFKKGTNEVDYLDIATVLNIKNDSLKQMQELIYIFILYLPDYSADIIQHKSLSAILYLIVIFLVANNNYYMLFNLLPYLQKKQQDLVLMALIIYEAPIELYSELDINNFIKILFELKNQNILISLRIHKFNLFNLDYKKIEAQIVISEYINNLSYDQISEIKRSNFSSLDIEGTTKTIADISYKENLFTNMVKKITKEQVPYLSDQFLQDLGKEIIYLEDLSALTGDQAKLLTRDQIFLLLITPTSDNTQFLFNTINPNALQYLNKTALNDAINKLYLYFANDNNNNNTFDPGDTITTSATNTLSVKAILKGIFSIEDVNGNKIIIMNMYTLLDANNKQRVDEAMYHLGVQ